VLAEGEAEWLTVRERLGDLFGPMGRRDAALEHYSAVLAASASAPHRARMHRKIGGLRWEAGDRDGALACLRNGLAVLEGEPEHVELAHLYQEMGRLAFRSGDNAGALDWATRALAHAERLAPAAAEAQKEVAAAVCQAYNTLGVAFARTGRLPEAVARIEQSVAVAEREGLLHAACRGYTNLGVLYATREPGRAIETCLSGLATAKKIGDLAVQSRLYANLAVAYCALTDRCDDEGIAAARQSIDLDRRLGQLDHLAVPLIVLGQIYQCHGEAERALGYYREALGFAEESGEPQLLFPCYDGLATLHLDLGDDATAEAYMRKAQAVCERAGVEPDSLIVLPFLG
jgi:adenylate cyclase